MVDKRIIIDKLPIKYPHGKTRGTLFIMQCRECRILFGVIGGCFNAGKGHFCSPKCRYSYFKRGGMPKGEHNKNWKGGRTTMGQYIKVMCKGHPGSDKNGYVLEHRLVMEKHIGRYLTNDEIVHHRNGIKTDNRLDNLTIVSRKAHYGSIICPHCQKEFVIR